MGFITFVAGFVLVLYSIYFMYMGYVFHYRNSEYDLVKTSRSTDPLGFWAYLAIWLVGGICLILLAVLMLLE